MITITYVRVQDVDKASKLFAKTQKKLFAAKTKVGERQQKLAQCKSAEAKEKAAAKVTEAMVRFPPYPDVTVELATMAYADVVESH